MCEIEGCLVGVSFRDVLAISNSVFQVISNKSISVRYMIGQSKFFQSLLLQYLLTMTSSRPDCF